MTYEEKLTHIVDFAQRRGWDFMGLRGCADFKWGLENAKLWLFGASKRYDLEETKLLFDHCFASALFGSESSEWADDVMEHEDDGWVSYRIKHGPIYLWYLQQLVILPVDERIDFCIGFIDDSKAPEETTQ